PSSAAPPSKGLRRRVVRAESRDAVQFACVGGAHVGACQHLESAALGEGSPDGWLCVRMYELAPAIRTWRRTSAASMRRDLEPVIALVAADFVMQKRGDDLLMETGPVPTRDARPRKIIGIND